ncbi:SLAC1 anion channel family protein [Neisseriaceae bacterium TC5R-5]|nr:SLAC1 anion channel family protein [Neisseriaceae bacterium TC5R-5]
MSSFKTPATSVLANTKKTISIKNLPINLFGSVMGLAGLSLAWHQLSQKMLYASLISDIIGLVAGLVFILLLLGYFTKWIKYPDIVKSEFNHPVIGNFFGTVAIAILLLSVVAAPYSTLLGQTLWIIGSGLTIILTVLVLLRLLSGDQALQNAGPVWLIPGVASLDITVTGAHMPMAWAYQFNLFAIAIGTMAAVTFFNLIFSRLVHQAQMPKGMTPSLMILIAPFEVGFMAYTNFWGQVDSFASLLFYSGLFLFVVLSFKVFRKPAPFSPAWWAISFPIAALSNAALKFGYTQQNSILILLSYFILTFLSITLAIFTFKTLEILLNGKLLSGE